MTSGLSSVALVVRLKSIALPSAAARSVAYATAVCRTLKFSSVSPPKNVRCALAAGLAQQEVHALPRRLLAHPLRLPAVLGLDDLVFAVLVAVGAAEIALVGDVQHHRAERHRRERQHFRHAPHGRLDVTQRADADELVERSRSTSSAAKPFARPATSVL